VVLGFGQSPRTASGVLIAGRFGQPVLAAAAGDVVYSGSGLTGYGQLVIIRHNAAWLSAYGHNEELLVAEGVRVRSGQQIARMGAGAGYGAALHFEIRRNGNPVDPLGYLPGGR
jgi:lipoprotein NlpD